MDGQPQTANLGTLWQLHFEQTSVCGSTGVRTVTPRQTNSMELALANMPADINGLDLQAAVVMFGRHPPRYRDNCEICGNCAVEYENLVVEIPKLENTMLIFSVKSSKNVCNIK